MTTNKLRIFGLLLTILSIMFFSCEMEDETVSVSERINLFEDDLNSKNFSSIADNFHPDMSSGQQAEWDATYADGIFADINKPFIFSEPTSTSGTTDITAIGDYQNGIPASFIYTFIMREDGDDNWKILSFKLDADVIFAGLSLDL